MINLEEAPFSNGLSPAQAERLALLMEECGEVIQAAGKILRHGYTSCHPGGPGIPNRETLTREIGDLQAAVQLMVNALDVAPERITTAQRAKWNSLGHWMHHQVGLP